jgi:hypothetical protein
VSRRKWTPKNWGIAARWSETIETVETTTKTSETTIQVRPARPSAIPDKKPHTLVECEISMCKGKEVEDAQAEGNQCRMKWAMRKDL